MASIKISELNEMTSLDSADLLPVVDSTADETKKITYSNIKTNIINDTFAIIQLTTPQNVNYAITEMPSGFTMQNSVVISIMEKRQNNDKWEARTLYTVEASNNRYYLNNVEIYQDNGTNYLIVYDKSKNDESFNNSIDFKIVLMKVA